MLVCRYMCGILYRVKNYSVLFQAKFTSQVDIQNSLCDMAVKVYSICVAKAVDNFKRCGSTSTHKYATAFTLSNAL